MTQRINIRDDWACDKKTSVGLSPKARSSQDSVYTKSARYDPGLCYTSIVNPLASKPGDTSRISFSFFLASYPFSRPT